MDHIDVVNHGYLLLFTRSFRRNSYSDKPESRDPLAALAKQYGASKRNALLK